jgi:putative ABC transport system permease protein
MWQSVRHAVRSLVADPVYAFAGFVILVLGIGVNVAVISAARAAFFPALPFAQANSLVALYEQAPADGVWKFRIPYSNYLRVREQKAVFSDVAWYIGMDAAPLFDLTEPGEYQNVAGAIVSANFFDVLGVRPVVGRTLGDSNVSGEPDPVAVIGYRLWVERFGGSTLALGRPMTLNGRVYEVAGVMPRDFSFPENSEVWLAGSSPETVSAIINSETTFTEFIPRTVARLQPGVGRAQAQAILSASLLRLREPHIEGWPHVTLSLIPLYDDLYGDARRPLAILFGAGGFVLLIAWALVSILCWVRVTRREKEFAVRAALGAGRWRLMLQFVVEGGLVSLAGSAGAILIGSWTARIIPRLIPSHGLPGGSGLADWHVLAYLAVVCALSAMIPSAWSARGAGRLDIARTLGDASYTSSFGPRRRGVLGILATVLVCVAFTLTAAAGLMVDNFHRVTTAPLGWEPANVWALSFNLHGVESPSRRLAPLFDNAVTNVQQLPGIRAAAVADAAPVPGSSVSVITVARAEGSQRELGPQGLTFDSIAVSPQYFTVLGISLLEGRSFTEADCVKSEPVAIVDQSVAQYFWGQADPVGRQMTASRAADGRVVTVVGVVRTNRAAGYASQPEPTIYTPIPSRLTPSVSWLLLRMQARAKPPINGIRRALSSLSPGTIPSEPRPAEQLLEEAGAVPRARADILSLFSILALALAAAGAYAVTAYAARQRVREFGIRMALGATRGGILRLMLRQTLLSLALGLAAGWILALGAAPVFRAVLYQPQATDLALLVAVSGVLSCAVLVASVLPAWRIAALDPRAALRYE